MNGLWSFLKIWWALVGDYLSCEHCDFYRSVSLTGVGGGDLFCPIVLLDYVLSYILSPISFFPLLPPFTLFSLNSVVALGLRIRPGLEFSLCC